MYPTHFCIRAVNAVYPTGIMYTICFVICCALWISSYRFYPILQGFFTGICGNHTSALASAIETVLKNMGKYVTTTEFTNITRSKENRVNPCVYLIGNGIYTIFHKGQSVYVVIFSLRWSLRLHTIRPINGKTAPRPILHHVNCISITSSSYPPTSIYVLITASIQHNQCIF